MGNIIFVKTTYQQKSIVVEKVVKFVPSFQQNVPRNIGQDNVKCLTNGRINICLFEDYFFDLFNSKFSLMFSAQLGSISTANTEEASISSARMAKTPVPVPKSKTDFPLNGVLTSP